MTIEARAFNLGETLGTIDGWEYRRCAVVYRHNTDGNTELYGTVADWDASPIAIHLKYEYQIVWLQEEVASLKAQLAERIQPAPEPTVDLACGVADCTYVGKNRRDLGLHKWRRHGIRRAETSVLRKSEDA